MKRGILFLIFLIVFIFFFSLAHAADLTDQIDSRVKQVEGTVDSAGKIISNPVVTREELKKVYLKQAWGQILESKPVIGDLIRGYRKISPYSDPAIEFVVGIAPNLSWYFLLVFVVWLVLVKYFYTFYEVLRDFSTFSDTSSAVISFCFFVILIVMNFFQTLSKWIADKVVSLFGLFSLWYVQLIALFAFIILLIILGKFSKQLRVVAAYIRIQNKKKRKEREERERAERQENATRVLETVAKAITEDAPSTKSMSRARAREESGEQEYERSTSDEL